MLLAASIAEIYRFEFVLHLSQYRGGKNAIEDLPLINTIVLKKYNQINSNTSQLAYFDNLFHSYLLNDRFLPHLKSGLSIEQSLKSIEEYKKKLLSFEINLPLIVLFGKHVEDKEPQLFLEGITHLAIAEEVYKDHINLIEILNRPDFKWENMPNRYEQTISMVYIMSVLNEKEKSYLLTLLSRKYKLHEDDEKNLIKTIIKSKDFINYNVREFIKSYLFTGVTQLQEVLPLTENSFVHKRIKQLENKVN